MNPLSRMQISTRLLALTLLVSTLLVGLCVFAYIKLTRITHEAVHAETVRMAQLKRMSDAETLVTHASLQLRHAMLSRTPEERKAALATLDDKVKSLTKSLDAYAQAIETEVERTQFVELKKLLDEFLKVAGANIEAVNRAPQAEAFGFLVDKTLPARNALYSAITKTVEFQQAGVHEEFVELQSDASITLWMLVGIAAVTVAALAILTLQTAAALKARVAGCQVVAERIGAGDLTGAIHDNARDEFSPLLVAMERMQTSLVRVVSEVRTQAEGVATASAQISQGNSELSTRTEQQSGSLQQTAATMEQLGTTVRNNADSARQASDLAQGASGVARRGGEVVGQVVQTMRGIQESSKRIADIIAVIDGIAFQTNILALNAAVEAARAGEQGRGFAVVASEVRSLAGRSAEAAREIKSLIGTSVDRVEYGSTLVGQAGQTMDEIVAAIQRVAGIVTEISSASVEQSNGVSHVGKAVQQMDQSTQQNAALVEQSAAAAMSMKAQAAQMLSAVAAFRTS